MRRLVLVIPATLLALPLTAQGKPSAAIPAMAPTQSVSDLPSAHPGLTTSVEEANVVWTGSALTIKANGDSLRNILRAVSQATGMKITGGVPEEQVFGSYGPGTVQDVLPQLFDGIAVNMMLVNDGAVRPRELVLTQRTGSVTPPQTRPIADEDQGFRRRRAGFGSPLQNAAQPQQPPQQAAPTQLPAQQAPAAATAQPSADSAAQPAPSTDANGQPQSPNGVRTPEQIFEELRKRQQQSAPSQ
jgi:hypothetical protein